MNETNLEKAQRLFDELNENDQQIAFKALMQKVIKNSEELDSHDEDEILEGVTTCCECGSPVEYNENGFECGKCGHGCC